MKHFSQAIPFFFIVITLLFFSSSSLFSQGSITGKIIDEQTGEPLVGANVLIVNTTIGAATDIEGNFHIRNIPEGTYTIRFSMVGYANKLVESVNVEKGKSLTMNLALESEAIQTNEVVITADAVYNTESAVLMKRKESSAISDGMSAEQIKRSPDATSGDALKRVTGLSLVDNKFVFVRGVTDRYNLTTLDGASVTSTESGKKGFSFDLLPASLLENTSVVKSGMPDLPGDFSGGLVQLNTLDFPSKTVFKLSGSSAMNSVTTSEKFLSSQSGSNDWFGFDDGSRAYPGDKEDRNQIAHEAANNWSPRSFNAPVNTSFALSFGDRVIFDREDPSLGQLGLITALSYRNTFQHNEKVISDFGDRIGADDENSVLWGAIANASYQIDGIHKIMFKNNFNQSATNTVGTYVYDFLDTELRNLLTTITWTQRSAYTGQLSGDHRFPSLGGLVVQWKASLSSSRREDPDRKEITYYRPITDTAVAYDAAVNKRSWAHLNDRTFSVSSDISYLISSFKIKAGALYEPRQTNYLIRYFDLTPNWSNPQMDSLASLPLETIYSPENISPKRFKFSESSRPTDSYEADQQLFASYAMLDIPFSLFQQNFRFTGGARLENLVQNINIHKTSNPADPIDKIQKKNIDILPSLNLTYYLSKAVNFRAAYYHSLNRPEFRELSPTQSYDFIRKEELLGNDQLERSFIHNYDARVEMFPEAGELLALSYFHKNISGAIEDKVEYMSTKQRTWENSPHAENSGWELEVRKSLNFLGSYFENASISANYTRIFSSVEYLKDTGTVITGKELRSRTLQGQSPYMINVSIIFTEPVLGTTYSILYNKFGSRIDAVGFRASDIYEEPRDLIDLAITHPITNLLEAKFTVKNLNGKDRLLTRDGELYERMSFGKTYTLQLSLGL
ncbi:MAG: TonB-dependent receptor [Bacteroidetes bacterium]|nr:MAG: TonB-dependent receptor [Bacteroidota bacterium]